MEKRKETYQKRIGIILVLQLVFVIFCVWNISKEKKESSFSQANLNILGGEFRADGTYCVNEENGVEGEVCLAAGPLSLKPGVYQVSFAYQTDAEQVTSVKDEGVGYRKLYQNAVSLHPTEVMKECSYRFMLLENTDSLNITIKYTGVGSMQISDVKLIHTGEEYSMLLTIALALFILLDFLLLYFGYMGKRLTPENKRVIFGLSVIIILSSLPIFVDYILWGDDQYFHMSRIEGIAREWKNGIFPVRMQGFWMDGMGYPASIMYGDVFLWFAAFLRFAGFDLAICYNGYILFTNILTAVIAYYSFKSIFKSPYVGVWCSAIYTLSLYRLYNVYVRSAIGEYTAMIFWPVICLGLVKVLSEDKAEVRDRKTVWILALGYMGVLYSHVLSLEMAVVFTVLIGVICFKRFFRKNTIFTFAKAAMLALGLSMWFIVPFLDYTLNVDMKVFHAGNPIQVLGLYVTQLFWMFPWSGNNNYMYVDGMQNVKAYGIGIGFMLILLVFIYIWIQKGKEWKAQTNYKMAKLSALIGAVACVMSLSLFPWDAISETSGLAQSMVYAIQFPYRLLSVATIALTLLAGFVFLLLRENTKQSLTKCYAVAILIFAILPGVFFMEDKLQISAWSDLREIASLGTNRVGNGEYLPYETDMALLNGFVATGGAGVTLETYEKRDCGATFICTNDSAKASYVDCSLLNYLGYQAKDTESGELLEIQDGDNHVLRVVIPAEYSGMVDVSFAGRTIWKVADICSLCIWIVCVFGLLYMKFGKYRKEMIAD